jgi:hypothetical protein
MAKTGDKNDRPWAEKDIALNGKLVTAIDATLIGESDFSELKNLRYKNTNPFGIGGQTLQADPPSNQSISTAIFSRHSAPKETHIVAQTYPLDKSSSSILVNNTAPPAAGNFSVTPLYSLIAKWASGHAYVLGDLVFPTTSNGYFYECSKAGNSGGTEPTWINTEYSITVDSGAKWITRKGDLKGSFSQAPNGFLAYANGKQVLLWGGNESRIGGFVNYDPAVVTGIYYDYTYKINDDRSDAEFTATLYPAADTKTYLLVGSVLPINGVKFYVKTPNSSTCATPTIKYWDGSNFTTVGTVTDGTLVGGKSLGQSGTMTFASTVNVAKPRIMNGIMLYWYQFTFTLVANTTQIFFSTISIPMQPVQDLWDGSLLQIGSLLDNTGVNLTNNVFKRDAVATLVSAGLWAYPPETVCDLTSWDSAFYLYIGFTDSVCGLDFVMAAGNTNTVASTLKVEYWNGTAYTQVTNMIDNTSIAGASLGQNGFVTWSPVDRSLEQKPISSDSGASFYYYRVSWSADIKCLIDFIAGIRSPESISGYNFPLLWLDSLWLCGKTSGNRNEVLSSSPGTVSVYNGDYSVRRTVGKNTEIVAGCTIFSRYGSDVSETLVLLKNDETWILNGTGVENIQEKRVSEEYGCTGKNTLRVCDLGYEIAPGINKSVAIWQSQNGIIMFDNSAFLTISQDIENFFLNKMKTSETDRLNYLYENQSSSYYDPLYKEYHWLFTDGSSTIVNREFVFDILRKKWFEIDRTTGKRAVCGLTVHDDNGVSYCYIFGTDGTMYITESGNTFDGVPITYSFKTSDKPSSTSMLHVTNLEYVKFISKNINTAGTLNLYHYADQDTTPTTVWSTVPYETGKRIFRKGIGTTIKSAFHQFRMSISTNDVPMGFEPIALSLLTKFDRYDKGRVNE